MNYTEIRKQAILSARLYYHYLDREGKGRAANSVRSFSILDRGLVKLMLVGKLASTDDIQVKILNRVFSNDEIFPVRYDKDERSLLLRPRQDFLSWFVDRSPNEIYVVSDLKFLVRRVEDWFENHTTPLVLPTVSPAPMPSMPALLVTPSEEQARALDGILHSPISYVWGAPGTGKTQLVLARAVLAYCLQGKQVLIAAPTNNAVEQTLKGVLSVLEEADIPLEKVIRLGIPSAEFFNRYPMVCEIPNIEKQVAQLDKELSFYQEAVTFCSALEWYELAFSSFSAAKARIEAIEIEFKQQLQKQQETVSLIRLKTAVSAPLLSQIELKTAERERLLTFLTQKRSGLHAWLLRQKIKQARDSLSQIDASLTDLGRKYEGLIKELNELDRTKERIEKEQRSLNSELTKIFDSLKALSPCPISDGRFAILLESLSPINFSVAMDGLAAELSSLKQSLDERRSLYPSLSVDDAKRMVDEISRKKATISFKSVASRLPDCLVVAATVDGFISRLSNNETIHPSHIFLDEAAYCPLIKAIPLLSLSSPFTMYGDHKQLPPVCEAPDSFIRSEGYESVCIWKYPALHIEDVFSQSRMELYTLLLSNRAPRFQIIHQYDLLQTFRFGESLASVLNQFVYRSNFHGNPNIGTSLQYISVPKRTQTNSKKHYNLDECRAIRQFLDRSSLSSYAVLTPYRDQRELLSKSFVDPDWVFTIHGSQGREWDTVIISIVETTQHWFLTPVLINTAVSRAKRRLILVCDADYWMKQTQHIIGGLLSAGEPY